MTTKREAVADPSNCFNRAHGDEPVFTLLGRDKSAPFAIWAWIDHRIATGKSTEESPEIQSARADIEAFESYLHPIEAP